MSVAALIADLQPPRFAGRRVIFGKMIPGIVDGLRSRDWLPMAEEVEREVTSQ